MERLEALLAAGPTSVDASLRFKPGDRVACAVGPAELEPGTIVKQHLRQEGQVVPYQVRLDKGTLIYVPEDNDRFCVAT